MILSAQHRVELRKEVIPVEIWEWMCGRLQVGIEIPLVVLVLGGDIHKEFSLRMKQRKLIRHGQPT